MHDSRRRFFFCKWLPCHHTVATFHLAEPTRSAQLTLGEWTCIPVTWVLILSCSALSIDRSSPFHLTLYEGLPLPWLCVNCFLSTLLNQDSHHLCMLYKHELLKNTIIGQKLEESKINHWYCKEEEVWNSHSPLCCPWGQSFQPLVFKGWGKT